MSVSLRLPLNAVQHWHLSVINTVLIMPSATGNNPTISPFPHLPTNPAIFDTQSPTLITPTPSYTRTFISTRIIYITHSISYSSTNLPYHSFTFYFHTLLLSVPYYKLPLIICCYVMLNAWRPGRVPKIKFTWSNSSVAKETAE